MPDLPHLASRLFGTPLLLARPKLDVVLRAIGPRVLGLDAQVVAIRNSGDEPVETSVTANGIAVVPIVGTLVARSGYLDAASGLMSYGAIAEKIVNAMGESGVRALLLEIDSPGGEVGGLFDLVDAIRAAREASGKPVWAVASEAALSAAYAIASAADRIYVTQTGEVGSIGVVAVHVDESGADAQAGLTWSFVHAGERKVDGNPHAPLSDRARADLQADVDLIYQQFAAIAARNRAIAPEAIRATEAAVYRGRAGVVAGLADRVGTLDQALADLAAMLDRSRSNAFVRMQGARPRSDVSTHGSSEMTDSNAPQGGDPAGPVQGDAHPVTPPMGQRPAAADDVAAQLRSEYAEIASIAAQAARLGVKVDAADALAKGVRADALRRAVLDELASRSAATDVVAVQPKPATPGDSPIVRRARERAAASRA